MMEYDSVPRPSSTRASSRKNRVYVFREFLLKTYCEDYLTKGSIVMDAAGGKGDLSWLLCNIDDFNSVVVDPRITKMNHILRSVRYLRSNPEEVKIRSVRNLPTYQPLAELLHELDEKQNDEDFTSPRHLRILLDNDLVTMISQIRKGSADMEEWEQFWRKAVQKGMQVQPLGYHEREEEDQMKQTKNDNNQQEHSSGEKGLKKTSKRKTKQISDAAEALQTILSTKLIVGFHPDQATDASVDLALELGIPFCVVPCCVFPSEFPNRTLIDDKTADCRRVRTYTELIAYLKLKSPEIQMTKLDFHFTETAKNIVLYTTKQANAEIRKCLQNT